jgi:hypothetical protein
MFGTDGADREIQGSFDSLRSLRMTAFVVEKRILRFAQDDKI